MPHSRNVQLRAARSQSGLNQDDIAFLLGLKSHHPISKLERGTRTPSLASAFSLECIFGQSASSLFVTIFDQIARTISDRARTRLQALNGFAHDPAHAARLRRLANIADAPRTLFDV